MQFADLPALSRPTDFPSASEGQRQRQIGHIFAATGPTQTYGGARLPTARQAILSAGMNASDTLSNELRDHVARTIGKIARPDSIEFVETLPKTRSGKIMRRLLKAKEAGQDIGDTSTLDPMSFADEEE